MRNEDFQAANFKTNAPNESEKLLHWLGHRAFLSWWSHPNPFKLTSPAHVPNKEVCDLLVVFGGDVLIFSDKVRAWQGHREPEVAWKSWYEKAVAASVRQLVGAEDFIRNEAGLLYADARCDVPLDLDREALRNARIHKIAICQGAEEQVRKVFGGMGTLMLSSTTDSGDLYRLGQRHGDHFVHTIDGESAKLLLKHLDTAKDFIGYLEDRERFYRSTQILMPGEDEALAIYMTTPGFPEATSDGETLEEFNAVTMEEGYAYDFVQSGKYKLWLEENEQSYILDGIIEKFRFHLINGTSVNRGDASVSEYKAAYANLAATSRVERRMIVGRLADMALDPGHCKPGFQRRAMFKLESHEEHTLVILVMDPHFGWSADEYLNHRRTQLQLLVSIAKTIQGPGRVSGLALNSAHLQGCSEDFVFVDDLSWDEEAEREARKAQEALNIWTGELWQHERHYALERTAPSLIQPRAVKIDRGKFDGWVRDNRSPRPAGKIGRNDPCPCGSGNKFKKCCLKKVS